VAFGASEDGRKRVTAGVEKFAGIGMTSARTRARMVERLREQGIRDEVVISAMEAEPMKTARFRLARDRPFHNPMWSRV